MSEKEKETETNNAEEKLAEGENRGANTASDPAVETPQTESVSVPLEVLNKLNTLIDKQHNTVVSLREKVTELHGKYEELSKEFESKRPIRSVGKVMGEYDFAKRKESFYSSEYKTDKEHAREIYNSKIRDFHRTA